MVSVVSGKDTRLCGPELTELGVDGAFCSFTVEQADSDPRTTVARHEKMNFFISQIFVYIVTLQHETTPSVGYMLWGVHPMVKRIHSLVQVSHFLNFRVFSRLPQIRDASGEACAQPARKPVAVNQFKK